MLAFTLVVALISAIRTASGLSITPRDDTDNITMPAPIAFTPDQNWDGIDGSWSSFTLRVGTPEQFVRVFISTQGYQTLVIAPEGCDTATDSEACADSRGSLFYRENSSTFDDIGIYETYFERNSAENPNAIYGSDRVGLSGVGEGGPTLDNTTVGNVALPDPFYMGSFGINPKPTNFTGFADGTPSYMNLLKEQGHIPSVSYGYTAGAHYRFTGVLASLTLGGYDTSKYEPNNVTFTFAPDNENDLTVALQSITTPSKISSSPIATELLPTPIYALIDSTLPMLYLPRTACEAFELEFGLIYDNTTSLYLVNDTLHERLLERDASVTLTLAEGLEDTDTVQITLPYAAFDHVAKPPYSGLLDESRYFPLQRTADETQYKLGRVFLQEAYITAAYEVSRFQVAQVVWDQTPEENLVAIAPSDAPNPSGDWTSSTWGDSDTSKTMQEGSQDSSDSSGISGGAIGGIVVGVVAVLGALTAFCFWRRRKNQRRKQAAAAADEKARAARDSGTDSEASGSFKHDSVYPKAELAGSQPLPFGMTHHEIDKNNLIGADSPTTRCGTPFTPTTAVGSAFFGHSPTTPSAGEGTYTSSQSGGLFSPTSVISEAGSRAVYEMPGDMPAVREKDGKQLSEKEALRHRENVYNGVDSSAGNSPTSPTGPEDSERQSRRINPDDVINAETGEHVTRHRAFSFEGSVDERNLK